MQSKATNVTGYMAELPIERQRAMTKLRKLMKSKLKGFEEGINYGMIDYHVSLKKFPNGYHCNPKAPLPFAGLASQKNFIALYHMGMYTNAKLLEWFANEYPKHAKSKLDMGKSCIRFKKMDDIPFQLIEELCEKMDADEWISLYTSRLDNRKNK